MTLTLLLAEACGTMIGIVVAFLLFRVCIHLSGTDHHSALNVTEREIKDAMEEGRDTTGLGTVRMLVEDMEKVGLDVTELCFSDHGKRYNVEVRILRGDDGH